MLAPDPVEFELLAKFEFTSDKKRMTIVIRDSGVVKVLTKGADNIISDKLKPGQLHKELENFVV